MRKLLAVEHVSKNYTQRKQVLQDIDLYVKEGEVVGLVGESGSGKSTLAKVIMQLESVQSGEVFFNGKPVNLSWQKKFYKDCQLVFQNASASFNPSWTVMEILREALNGGKKREEADTYIRNMLGKVQLTEIHLNQRPSQLSGGEKQRVNLLRALLVEPKLLICDEIVSNLDRITQKEIVDLLLELNRESGLAILFISHDLRVVEYMCERIYVLDGGTMVDESVKENGEFAFSHPYSKRLFAAIHKNK